MKGRLILTPHAENEVDKYSFLPNAEVVRTWLMDQNVQDKNAELRHKV